MLRLLFALACLASGAAVAQTTGEHDAMHRMHMASAAAPAPTQTGQSAFAAIQEIVEILEADPKTDWSKVDVEALRRHLIDMNNVTLGAEVRAEPVDGGMRFTATGAGAVRDSIRRMVAAHAAAMNGMDGWTYASSEIEDGATLTVLAPAKDRAKLRGLGFIGVMALGMHHAMHHLMIARGENPHPF